ncbi:MAG: HEAT repeat domain-containing protein [Planctomycetes bacterium]|nr:HEAT repeat domain-containing protein [Planctomycetota bacterium]
MSTSTYRLYGWRGSGGLVMSLVIVGFLGMAVTGTGSRADDGPTINIPAGATGESLFKDFMHYARMGRFTAADAFARALLAHPELDAVTILDLSNQDKKSVDTLLILIKNSTIGDNATKVLDLIHQGEHERRQNPDRIRENIANLALGPQQEYFAIRYLVDSGEYAVPYVVGALLDPANAELTPRLVNAMTKFARPAVTPLALALAMRDNDARLNVIHTLGEIGYPHALPYLRELLADENAPGQTKQAAAAAIERIHAITGRTFPGTAADLFLDLAEKYYNEDDMVRADPRIETANVWYWDESAQAFSAIIVPARIFGQIMAMRCAQEVLRFEPARSDATALWLAANIRRESRLGMNVESGDPNETGDPDATRPAVFPRAMYFTQAAGPYYAHLVLARAVRDGDTAVALGAIEALRVTAGETSLVGQEDLKQPLVQALHFPELLVRIRAALALGAALPKSPFADSQHVIPLLAEAVTLTGNEQVLVIDRDEANVNRVMEVMRAGGRAVIGETDFPRAIARVRAEFQSLRGIFLATGSVEPSTEDILRQLRQEFLFGKTPVILLTKPRDALAAEDLAAKDGFLELVDAAADGDALEAAYARAQQRTGLAAIDDVLASELAAGAVEVLRRIAVDGRTVYSLAPAESALIAALDVSDEGLQTAAARVLALIPTPTAQRAIAAVALDSANPDSLRLAAYDSLSESAKNNGNLLAEDQLDELIGVARDEADLTMRTAASQALGAVNLSTSKASEIIRSYPSD